MRQPSTALLHSAHGDRDPGATVDITRLQPAGLVVSPAFSHVAIVPPGVTTIYVGGQNGIDAAGTIVSADIAEQSRQAVDNVATALNAAGASLSDVVQWTVWIDAAADLGDAYGAIAPRLAGPGAPPLVTAARVAGLGVPGALIEVSAVAAVIPASDRVP
ncbi:RidA family protein [Cryobacterium sp. 1639]|nr:RidA family protein [Cryobacterium sp. 1639]